MTTPPFEAFLARLYTDAAFRERVMADPRGEAQRAGLSAEQSEAIARLDRPGLGFTARSLEKKKRLRPS
ncbi:MAG: hypothetical protein FJW31_05795 [Acidobacteria bacterium]|nr:hypothetical protein [Acidobacteriota bacterium]